MDKKCDIKINQEFFILYDMGTKVKKQNLLDPNLEGPLSNTLALDPLAVQNFDKQLCISTGLNTFQC